MAYSKKRPSILIELNAVVISVFNGEPFLLVDSNFSLPSGPFETEHRSLEQGLREWAEVKGQQPIGYVEQLYTFADKGRTTSDERSVSIGYMALVHQFSDKLGSVKTPWYYHFPWEDHRKGYPSFIKDQIIPALNKWKNSPTDKAAKQARAARIESAFPTDPRQWNEELVLQRYELLWEAGLVEESGNSPVVKTTGIALPYDHRRIVATAIARLRAKIKYRPVVFELLPKQFTLLQLQSTVEALAGVKLHKQNFRRLIESQKLVEETGALERSKQGRPAKLFSFRRQVLQERAIAGTKLTKA